jgi:hypothetical protein
LHKEITLTHRITSWENYRLLFDLLLGITLLSLDFFDVSLHSFLLLSFIFALLLFDD